MPRVKRFQNPLKLVAQLQNDVLPPTTEVSVHSSSQVQAPSPSIQTSLPAVQAPSPSVQAPLQATSLQQSPHQLMKSHNKLQLSLLIQV